MALAVTNRYLLFWLHLILIVASFAHVVCAEAEVDSDIAAVDALPVDMLSTMLLTDSLPSAVGLNLALFAQQVFFLGRVLHL